MAKGIGPPVKSTQTPTIRWVWFLIVMPWLQLVTGIALILFAKTKPSPLSLFEGAAISLYAVALLASTVCAFGSPSPPPISDRLKNATYAVFQIVLVLSVVFVVLTQTGNVLSTKGFLSAQGLLALIALPFSWRARA
jgi:hypothetical protein